MSMVKGRVVGICGSVLVQYEMEGCGVEWR